MGRGTLGVFSTSKFPEGSRLGVFSSLFGKMVNFGPENPQKKVVGYEKTFLFLIFSGIPPVKVLIIVFSTNTQEEFRKGPMPIDIFWFFVFGLDLFTWPALYCRV